MITVVLKVIDQQKAKEFWDAMIAERQIHGCEVVDVQDGDTTADFVVNDDNYEIII